MNARIGKVPRTPVIELEGEEWRAIAGHPGYAISNMGRVKSVARTLTRKHPKTGRPNAFNYVEKILVGSRRRRGARESYVLMNLDGEQLLVHRLVLEAFVGPAPAGYEACHCNGDPRDNRLANLRWDTAKGNAADRCRHGTQSRGEAHPFAKYPATVVRQLREGVMGFDEAHATYGISRSHFLRIRRGEGRAHD